MTDALVILCTCASSDEAGKIANHLVEHKIAACVSILPAVRSVYRWQNKIENNEEQLILIKSTRGRFSEVERAIRRLHSYDLPEIIALPIIDGLSEYLRWIHIESSDDEMDVT